MIRSFLEQGKVAHRGSTDILRGTELGSIQRRLENPPPTPLPFYLNRISAGFPSPADDYVEERIDLNEQLIRNKAATFFLRVQGDSMLGSGIHPGDRLVVDRSLQPKNGDIVIAVLDGELTVKRLVLLPNGGVELHPENLVYPVIRPEEFQQLDIWGVVTNVIHPLRS